MVSVNPNPAQGFYFFYPTKMGLPDVNHTPPLPAAATTSASAAPTADVSTASCEEDLSKKIRKPYTITKSRKESWTEQEHEKFLEALQLVEAFQYSDQLNIYCMIPSTSDISEIDLEHELFYMLKPSQVRK